MKVNCGNIQNPETGETKDIIVSPEKGAVAKLICCGIGMVTCMVTCMVTVARTSFKHGVRRMDQAELETLEELGLINYNQTESKE